MQQAFAGKFALAVLGMTSFRRPLGIDDFRYTPLYRELAPYLDDRKLRQLLDDAQDGVHPARLALKYLPGEAEKNHFRELASEEAAILGGLIPGNAFGREHRAQIINRAAAENALLRLYAESAGT